MKNNKIVNTISTIFSILLVVLSVSLIYSLYRVNILKTTYIIIGILILALIDFLLIKFINKKERHNYKRYIGCFISLIFISLYFLGISYALTTASFVDNITKTNDEYQTYYVKVNSDIKKIKELDNKTIGFIENNVYLDSVKSTLSDKAGISFDAKDYSDNDSINDDIKSNKINAVVLEKSYIDTLKENDITIFDKYKTIYKFKVKMKKETKKSEVKSGNSFILYISGSDSRGSLSDIARSDVNIVAVVNPTKHKILLVSIPRDYYVQLHGTTGSRDKLTHAGIYGVDMSKSTINDLLGINIDRYLKVGFDTVIKSVDLLGGIDVYSDTAFTAHTNRNCSFEENRAVHVNGDCALAFARERYAYSSGDRHRGENQEQVITKMIEKVSKPSILTKYSDILKSLDGSFETDMSYNEITSLIKDELSTLKPYQVESISLDGSGASESTYSMGSQKLYVMIPDESTVENAKNKIKEYLK